VAFVDALPKTRSAKIVRRVVRAAVTGDDAGDTSTLEDPRSSTRSAGPQGCGNPGTLLRSKT
jgi:hypothetical protein